jgi:(p)ppGpp synthase/HD superfamily hydrolase
MIDITLEERAHAFATQAHAGQKRKYTGEPYVQHPAAVADLVRSVPHTEAMLAAAWLHDTVEDCGVTIAELEKRFGDEVAQLVSELTDISKPSDGNRAARKAIDCAHIAKASPAAKTVKLADLIDNSKSIVEHDPEFARVYLAEKRALCHVLKEGHIGLWARAVNIAYGGTP